MKSSFFTYQPNYPVNNYVQLIWLSRGEKDTTKSRVLPNGTIELILNFGDIQKTLYDTHFKTKNTFKNFWVAGLQEESIIIQSENDTNLLGIRFKPGGAHSFFQFPILEIANIVIELDWMRLELERLRDQIYSLSENVQIFNLVEQYLLNKIRYSETNKAINFVISMIASSPDVLINDLITKTGYSHKHCISLFKNQVGVTPKTLQRIIRFQKVIQVAKRDENIKWNDILYNFSYYDPAHFVNDFKKLSGLTPDQYLASRTFDENHCIIR